MLAAERESANTAIRAFERRNVAGGSQFYRLRLVFVKERRFLTSCPHKLLCVAVTVRQARRNFRFRAVSAPRRIAWGRTGFRPEETFLTLPR